MSRHSFHKNMKKMQLGIVIKNENISIMVDKQILPVKIEIKEFSMEMEINSVPIHKLTELIKRIEEIVDADEYCMEFFSGASDKEIAQFESDNGFTFPVLYKEWLRFADGCCMFNLIQLYGVSNNPQVEPKSAGVESHYICIGALSFGDAVCFSDNSPKIIRYGEKLIEYEDFNAFLEYIIELGGMD